MNNSDSLLELPTDKIQPTYEEIKVINSFFKEPANVDVKDSIITDKKENEVPVQEIPDSNTIVKNIVQYAFLTFLILLVYSALPNNIIKNILPSGINDNEFVILFIKAVIISCLFYLFKRSVKL